MTPQQTSAGNESRPAAGLSHDLSGGLESAHDGSVWGVLAGAKDAQEFCQSWLAIQCRMIPGVEGGLVLLLAEADSSYAPAAVWPDVRRDMSYLTQPAQQALTQGRGVVLPIIPEGSEVVAAVHIAYPIEAIGKLHGVVVLHLAPQPESELQAALRQLHWGAASLELLFVREEVYREQAAKNRLQTVLELIGAAAGHERYGAAATSLATELATRLQCERVIIGFLRGNRVHIDAVSHSAQFKERTNLLKSVAAAMEEAIDQGLCVVRPALPGKSAPVGRAHAELAQAYGCDSICSVPLACAGKAVGAITFERSSKRPFDAHTVELCEALAGLAGPFLEVHRREDQWFPVRLYWWSRGKAQQLLGAGHLGFKLGARLVAAVFAFLVLARGDYRVAAETTLEPLVQQAAVASFNGYVREAPVRAGDLVKQGTLLVALDDRELKLERLKHLSEQEEQLKQYRQAMAEHNAAQVQILGAQLEQSRAQVERVEDQLIRTRVVAPFDGVVVSGDLTQSLGAPVERGTVLYEIAPLSAFRVILKVDERDMADIAVGQHGSILLSAFPHDPIAFQVEKVTPVSTPKEGKNFFRVEAKLEHSDPRLRPGMEGVGKIDIQRRSIAWIWTHQALDSLRLTLWKWLP
jgi:RND family efflux transporter MFP subunit